MKEIVIISGASGAGKTTTSNILEDLGYLCIDKYPQELLNALIKLLENSNDPKYERVVLTISLLDLDNYLNVFKNASIKSTIIILDTSSEELIRRYKFTRRVHPLMLSNMASSVEDSVEIEKGLIEKYRRFNAHIIDTTELNKNTLKEMIEHILHKEDSKDLSISFESFGYKYGVPKDADVILDCRVLVNPFYEDDLRELTGNDTEVIDYLFKDRRTEDYLEKIYQYLDFVFKEYDDNQRRHIMVCVGCTGGQHRSVVITNYLYDRYKDKYACYKIHRELKK